ncbi:MAG: L,D-transpeptidase [Nocardioidaceae bacterium]|nr:L,D-transpeptidase [Nocardioidaceae bacterium]
MSARHGGALRSRAHRRTAALAGFAALSLAVAGCSGDNSAAPRPKTNGEPVAASSAPPTPEVQVRTNVQGAAVKVDKTVKVSATDGRLEKVTVKAKGAKLPGKLSADRSTWTSTGTLEPGLRYKVTAAAVDGDGLSATRRSSFHTQDLTLDQQTFPSFVPVQGQTVGVGMPVIVRFDVAVTDKARIEKHLKVTNTAGQKGSWHWISDNEVHWRPVHYWQPGTDVTVTADINSVPAGNGVFGQLDRTSTFHVGDAMVSRVNAQSHQMKVFRNGNLIRTIPITTGKPGFTTRSGTKVIIEKFPKKRMNSETVGIARNSSEGYDIDDVRWAMRVTYSGEFLHAAPWSVGSQGHDNVSHGCTGMSTSNAAWLYGISKIGDVVEYTGTNRPMTLTNGYGDWNESFDTWRQGSALG